MGADDCMAIARTIASLGVGGEEKKYLPQRHEVREEAKQG
jgi:hypothetical protein